MACGRILTRHDFEPYVFGCSIWFFISRLRELFCHAALFQVGRTELLATEYEIREKMVEKGVAREVQYSISIMLERMLPCLEIYSFVCLSCDRVELYLNLFLT